MAQNAIFNQLLRHCIVQNIVPSNIWFILHPKNWCCCWIMVENYLVYDGFFSFFLDDMYIFFVYFEWFNCMLNSLWDLKSGKIHTLKVCASSQHALSKLNFVPTNVPQTFPTNCYATSNVWFLLVFIVSSSLIIDSQRSFSTWCIQNKQSNTFAYASCQNLQP